MSYNHLVQMKKFIDFTVIEIEKENGLEQVQYEPSAFKKLKNKIQGYLTIQVK